eukprot:CAMPEP_0181394042 /NCGR_PEP_ID=MMETSP1106-20121128/27543_1 /TAXON_ID=81844 /ORGANISM="Mantoniella antarctica, Strain SL-175" /LENGTH=75 /DNA_ID=CAMNT_0023515465 /DNA_START=243 /DNA_END=470 /DNA_ORIENTATION=+
MNSSGTSAACSPMSTASAATPRTSKPHQPPCPRQPQPSPTRAVAPRIRDPLNPSTHRMDPRAAALCAAATSPWFS